MGRLAKFPGLGLLELLSSLVSSEELCDASPPLRAASRTSDVGRFAKFPGLVLTGGSEVMPWEASPPLCAISCTSSAGRLAKLPGLVDIVEVAMVVVE